MRISSAIILNPDNPVLLTALGDAYMKQNVTALAITNYQKAIELAPAEFGTRFKLARTFEKEKK